MYLKVAHRYEQKEFQSTLFVVGNLLFLFFKSVALVYIS